MKIGIIQQLAHCTVRIETTLKNGGTSCGTGFFMNLIQSEKGTIPAIITNKHVIEDSVNGKFHLTVAKSDGSPDLGNHVPITVNNFEEQWIPHPDPKVDLAAFLIAPILNYAETQGINPYFIPLDTNLIPTSDVRESLSMMEDVIMIGYPSGIWDKCNNLPVIRRGITATHPFINWNGNTEFLTDIASFPGSSGSPVLVVNIGGYVDIYGNTIMGGVRILLLGVHYAGTQHMATGEINIVQAPTSNVPISITNIPNNIGIAINSNRLLDFVDIINQIRIE